jgi:hypothetical protein
MIGVDIGLHSQYTIFFNNETKNQNNQSIQTSDFKKQISQFQPNSIQNQAQTKLKPNLGAAGSSKH